MGKIWHFAALAALVFGVGCGPSGRSTSTTWTLNVPGQPVQLTRLPTHIDHLLPENASFSLTSSVAIPAEWRGSDIFLEWPFFQGRTTATVDGHTLTRTSFEFVDGHRRRGPQSWLIPAPYTDRATVLIEFSIENTWTQAGWIDTVPILTSAASRHPSLIEIVNVYVAAIAAVGFAQVSAMYLLVYFMSRHRKTFLWFGLQGLAASYYPLFLTGVTQTWAGPSDVAVMAITVATAAVCSIYCTYSQFNLGTPSRVWSASFAVVCLAGIFASGPFQSTSVTARLAVCLFIAAFTFQIFVLSRLVRQRPRPVGAGWLLMAWIALAVLASGDFIGFLGFGEIFGGVRAAGFGLLVFSLLQSLILSRQHIFALASADTLNVELADRIQKLEVQQKEVEVLNTELRHQIADRSGQLVAALCLKGRANGEAPDLVQGDLVRGRYEVDRKIGYGGMGSVYEVHRLADRQRFALKLARELDAETLARLAREAQIASQIHHPNVVSIVDIDVAESGFMYLILEYVEGDTLRQLTQHYGDLAWSLDVLTQLVTGLSVLHAKGVIHRDLKPTNIMIISGENGAPLVKIADFGISKLQVDDPNQQLETGSLPDLLNESPWLDTAPSQELSNLTSDAANQPAPTLVIEAEENTGDRKSDRSKRISTQTRQTTGRNTGPELTRVGTVLGTPRYMAPELAKSKGAASTASDMFGVGIIAFELLTRKRPFKQSAYEQAMSGERLRKPPPMSKMVPELDRSIAAAIDSCLSFSPTSRPTAEELLGVFLAAQTEAP